MLTKVEVRTRQGTLLSLPLDDVSSGFIVQDVDGLGPVKATLASSGFAGLDGEQYHSSRRETRNVKIQLGLDPDPLMDSVFDLRKLLYGFFMPKSPVDLRFYEDDLVVNISGRVESFEPAIFSAEPAVDISIICFDPDFIDPTSVELSGSTTSGSAEMLIEYDGTVDTGMIFTLNVDRAVDEFTLYHRTPSDETRILDFSSSLVAGDVLTISTVAGSKGATLVRSGTSSSVLYAISPPSSWTELEYGDNHIRVYAEGAGIPFEIEYVTRYGGL